MVYVHFNLDHFNIFRYVVFCLTNAIGKGMYQMTLNTNIYQVRFQDVIKPPSLSKLINII